MELKYTIKIGYKEKTQNNIDARRPFFGAPSSTEKYHLSFFLSLYQYLADFDGDEVYCIHLYTHLRV